MGFYLPIRIWVEKVYLGLVICCSPLKNTGPFFNANVITLTPLLECPQRLFVVFRPNTNFQYDNKGPSRLGPGPVSHPHFLSLLHRHLKGPVSIPDLAKSSFLWLYSHSSSETIPLCLLSTCLPQHTSYCPGIFFLSVFFTGLWHFLGARVLSFCLLSLGPSLGLST